ncbi:MAG TPA: type VI secretion system tube protein TssD [bacterium]
MKRFALASVVSICALLVLAGGALAADTMYMTATAAKQGQIRGSVTLKGLEGWMRVLDLDHNVISPRDPVSGLPTGRTQHKPLVVKIPLDKSGPMFINALVTNENLLSVEIAFYREMLRNGVMVPTRVGSIMLTNANVASETTVNPDDKNPAGSAALELALTYQKIQWTFGGITAMDDWMAPIATQP